MLIIIINSLRTTLCKANIETKLKVMLITLRLISFAKSTSQCYLYLLITCELYLTSNGKLNNY